MKVPDRAWTRENSPRFSAAEQKARCQAASITSLIAQEYSGVGLTVNQQWPGSRPVNSPRQQDATTGGLCCEIEEHQVSTTIEGVPSSVELRRRPVVDQAALTSSS